MTIILVVTAVRSRCWGSSNGGHQQSKDDLKMGTPNYRNSRAGARVMFACLCGILNILYVQHVAFGVRLFVCIW